jgi:hypothetical protein
MDYTINSNLARTFNTAKKYAEEILFPKMDMFQKFQRQAEFGAEEMKDALFLSNELKDIQRFNGLKGMNDTLFGLLLNISSTVRVNKNKTQLAELDKMLKLCKDLKLIFDSDKDKFFEFKLQHGGVCECLERNYFYKIKNLVEVMYVNCEILMTKNKLLFAENREEFMSDKDIIQNIKSEYIEN